MMNRRTSLFIATAGIVVSSACLSIRTTGDATGYYDTMLASARTQSWFPNGETHELTMFSHIGYVNMKGAKVGVVHMRASSRSLSPRGQARLLFFGSNGSYLGYRFVDSFVETRVCDESYVYFWGFCINENSNLIGPQGDIPESGNALDLSNGIEAARFVKREFIGLYNSTQADNEKIDGVR